MTSPPALAAPTDHERDRVKLRDGEAPHARHQGRRLEDRRTWRWPTSYSFTAQERWRRFTGHEVVTDVLDGVTFNDGTRVTDNETTTMDEKVAD